MDDHPVKVLVVEDNLIAQLIETKIVRQCHCEVDAASTGAQALDLIQHNHYDLILMDIGLPDTDGLKLTDKIRHTENMNQTVPIVALTAHDETKLKNQVTEVGMNSFIVKPLTPENFEEVLKILHA